MNRRSVLKGLLAVAAAAPGFRLPLVHAADYFGKLFVFVQADGGWDPTSFCDPKANTPGEPVINHWAVRDEVRQAGNLTYAPFAGNQAFFEKYHRMMLVINGVDARRRMRTRWASCGEAQLERAELRGISDPGCPVRRPLCLRRFRSLMGLRLPSGSGFSNTPCSASGTDPLHPPQRLGVARRRHGAAAGRRGRPCRGLLARGRLRHGFLPRRQGRASEDPLSRPHAGERQGHTESSQAKSHISGSCAPTSGSSLSPTPPPTIGPSWRPCRPKPRSSTSGMPANISERHPTMRWPPTGSRGTARFCVTTPVASTR